MAEPRLADTDVVALARRFLLASEEVTQALGGEGAIGDKNRPPYPRVRLTDPPGLDLALDHLMAPMLQIEVLGEPGTPGQKPVLRRLLYDVLQALKGLPEAQATGAWGRVEGEPVCTFVESTGGGGSVPEVGNQPRYIAVVRLYVHP